MSEVKVKVTAKTKEGGKQVGFKDHQDRWWGCSQQVHKYLRVDDVIAFIPDKNGDRLLVGGDGRITKQNGGDGGNSGGYNKGKSGYNNNHNKGYAGKSDATQSSIERQNALNRGTDVALSLGIKEANIIAATAVRLANEYFLPFVKEGKVTGSSPTSSGSSALSDSFEEESFTTTNDNLDGGDVPFDFDDDIAF